jgi:hypothetical protein
MLETPKTLDTILFVISENSNGCTMDNQQEIKLYIS